MTESEWQTRKQRIDTRLRALHPPWQIIMQWLSLVREHLVKNLSMDEEDFDLTPRLGMRGGKAKAKKVFADLPRLVAELHNAVAS